MTSRAADWGVAGANPRHTQLSSFFRKIQGAEPEHKGAEPQTDWCLRPDCHF